MRTRGDSGRNRDEFDAMTQPSRTVTGKSDSWERGGALETHRDQHPDGTTQEVEFNRPAPAVTAKAGGQWKLRTGANSMVTGRKPNDVSPYERDVDRPAPTVDTKAHGAWSVATGNSTKGGTRPGLRRSSTEPSRTVDSASTQWTRERPATTIMGDRRVFPPGGHHPENGDPSWSTRAIKVELWELAVLQDFPPDFPWQGNKTQIAQQVGNAIPVGLASAVLRQVV